jgi:large subunit ribosomal protein L17
MRHLNHKSKLNRTGSHRRCMIANALKSLIVHGRIETTEAKAKVLRSYADQLVTLAKANTLAARRKAIAELMVRFNTLTPKEQRLAKTGKTGMFNDDRIVINKLFDVLGPRFAARNGGYTRIIKNRHRVGDNAMICYLEYLED